MELGKDFFPPKCIIIISMWYISLCVCENGNTVEYQANKGNKK